MSDHNFFVPNNGLIQLSTNHPKADSFKPDSAESTSWLLEETDGIRRICTPQVFRGAFLKSKTLSPNTIVSNLYEQNSVLAQSPDGAWLWTESTGTIDIEPYEKVSIFTKSSNRHTKERYHDENESTRHKSINPPCDSEFDVLAGLTLRIAFVDTIGVRHVSSPIICTQQLKCFDGKTSHNEYRRDPVHFDETVSTCLPNVSVAIKMREQHAVLDIQMRNPNRSHHEKGYWDLGDPGNRQFLAFEVWIESDEQTTALSKLHLFPGTSGMTEIIPFDRDARLVQRASAACTRRAIKNEEREKLEPSSIDSLIWEDSHLKKSISNARANPLVTAMIGHSNLGLYIPKFWEEFPTAVRRTGNAIVVELVAIADQHTHELQGGESKRFSLELIRNCKTQQSPEETQNFSMQTATLRHQIQPWPKLPEEVIISFCGRSLSMTHWFDQVIKQHIEQPSEFKQKRENIDEYGWRDFGEVWADHECHYQDDFEKPYVSHYNNQYDLVLGFALMWLRSGDQAWFELMNDLARHVVDIDIYSTNEDRPEYNHGMFWHTSHYVDAATSTHRSWSIKNSDPNDPSSLGGGPSAEHCYTTGLALHYLLTGDSDSRNAVTALASWISRYCDGDCTLASLTLHSIRLIRKSWRLEGKSKCAQYRYPLNRATGNRVVAMLDAHYLTGESSWLKECSSVINATFNENDDISARGLCDTEHRWSYVVFLESVMRFLGRKESIGEHDRNYWTARRAFVYYCEWMAEHDGPWIERSEQLEYVNDTWLAQDARRVSLLQGAIARAEYSYVPALKSAAIDIANSVSSGLRKSDSAHYARIQALLMWNAGASTAQENALNIPTASLVPESHKRQTSVWPSIGRSLLRTIRNFDLKQEWRWIKAQIGRLS